jgi:hypothetical protein
LPCRPRLLRRRGRPALRDLAIRIPVSKLKDTTGRKEDVRD